MGVRAKFYVRSVELFGYSTSVKLGVVTRGEDNKQWSAATPSGELTMNIKNELAAAQFTPGDEFFVDFTPAPKGEEGMSDQRQQLADAAQGPVPPLDASSIHCSCTAGGASLAC